MIYLRSAAPAAAAPSAAAPAAAAAGAPAGDPWQKAEFTHRVRHASSNRIVIIIISSSKVDDGCFNSQTEQAAAP
jgi:hypothetical protein